MTIQFTRWSWASWLLKGLGQRWLYHTAHHRLFLRGLGNSVKSHLKIGYPTSDGSSAHHHFTIFFLPWIPFWTKQKAKPPANRLAQSKNLKRFAVQRRHTHTHLDMYIYIQYPMVCIYDYLCMCIVYRVCGISYRYINKCWTSNVFTVKRLKALMNLANLIATNQSTCRAGSPDFSSLLFGTKPISGRVWSLAGPPRVCWD